MLRWISTASSKAKSERLPAGHQHRSAGHGGAGAAIEGRPAGDPHAWWEIALSDFAATVMPLRPIHVAGIHGLQAIHRDPFDRALIAQATVEDLVLVTTDAEIPLYASERLRVIRRPASN